MPRTAEILKKALDKSGFGCIIVVWEGKPSPLMVLWWNAYTQLLESCALIRRASANLVRTTFYAGVAKQVYAGDLNPPGLKKPMQVRFLSPVLI